MPPQPKPRSAQPRNHLSDVFYTMPGFAVTTMRTTEYRETLLATDGQIIACGYLWRIRGQSLGAGVYRVTLTREE